MEKLVLVPAGGLTSTLARPACRFTLRFSVPAAALISASVRRVSGRTVIVLLPTSIIAVLLKPVDTTVSWATLPPTEAELNAVLPALFSSTSPFNSRIIPYWAKAYRAVPINSTVKNIFFMVFTPY
jgi:hypothetical protein